MYNKPLTFAATTLLLCSPVMILTSCEGEKDSAAQAPALVPEVQVTKLVTKDVPIRQEWVGTLRGTEDAEIRSQVTGYLLSKDYRDGAYVKKGQVLFQIDPRPFQATLDQAQGRLEQYEATLKKYKLDVERYTPLVKTGSVSRKHVPGPPGFPRGSTGIFGLPWNPRERNNCQCGPGRARHWRLQWEPPC